MQSQAWQSLLVPENEHGSAWEIYHENSKTSRHDVPIDSQDVRKRMDQMWPSLPYEGYPAFALSDQLATFNLSLDQTILSRETARTMSSGSMDLDQLSSLLHYSYGITRSNEDGEYPRPFRVVPSGGALYPLELYFHSSHIGGLRAGIYHYNPTENCVRLLREGDFSRQLSQSLVQQNLALDSTLMVFITALFERSLFKYGERGYRFTLMEAGHVSQNMNLVATALGKGVVNIGGFFDRDIDSILGLDGVLHTTLYCMAIGERVEMNL